MSEFKELSRSVKGLTVLVTGAASGMGRATARVFAAEGANVAVTDFDEQGAQAVAKEIAAKRPASAKAWKLDVADARRDQARGSAMSRRISAGSTSSSTMPASPCASRSTTRLTKTPGPRASP